MQAFRKAPLTGAGEGKHLSGAVKLQRRHYAKTGGGGGGAGGGEMSDPHSTPPPLHPWLLSGRRQEPCAKNLNPLQPSTSWERKYIFLENIHFSERSVAGTKMSETIRGEEERQRKPRQP